MRKTLCSLILAGSLFLSTNIVKADSLDKILDAIQYVESGNKGENVPDGDNGKAIGPLQIHEIYYKDAATYDKSLGNDYSRCRELEFSRRVVRAYVCKYLKETERTPENVARLHNGGITTFRGSHNRTAWKNTTKYWNRVKNRMKNNE